ncbi:hypothetical protein [Lentzea indica]|uniref:hypothetical protein n=1 Tax=Lentzea indica TaxID=2604800 RepID=UPI001FE47C07|nr:hypothetical protein [Lentzea indica]
MIEPATYDIAVSFAEEQRAVVDEVVEACRQRGLTVLESNDLPQAQVRFFVPFVSTVDDLTVNEHVLPVLTGEVPTSLPHVTYLRADEHLVDALVTRVEAAETAGLGRVPVAEVAATIKQPPNTALRQLAEQFAIASPGLTKRGLAGTMHLGDTTIAVRVERSGDTVYALEVQRGGDEIVNFVVLGGSTELFPTLCQRIEDMLAATEH